MCNVCNDTGYVKQYVKAQLMKGHEVEYEIYKSCPCSSKLEVRESEPVKDKRNWWKD